MNISHLRVLHLANGLSIEQITSYSHEFVENFPQDYIDFLTKANGCYLYSNYFDKETYNGFNYRGMVGVNAILHFGYDAFYDTLGIGDPYDIFHIFREVESSLPKFYLPIAYCEGGNYVFLNLKTARIYFQDHEKMDLGEIGLVELATTFSEFIQRIKFNDPLN
jgi:hypothetical protein